MNKQLKVIVKNNYGVTAIYPACEQTQLLCQVAGSKTLTDKTIGLLKQLGYTFTNVTPTPTQLEI